MLLPKVRECVFHGVAIALAAPPVLALADTVIRERWFAEGVSVAMLLMLPVLLLGAAFLGAPVSIPAGAIGGLALAWVVGRAQTEQESHRYGVMVGVGVAVVILAVLLWVDPQGWGHDTGVSLLFPVIGALCGWLTARVTFRSGAPHTA